MPRLVCLAVLVLLLALAAAGCGGGSDGDPSAGSPATTITTAAGDTCADLPTLKAASRDAWHKVKEAQAAEGDSSKRFILAVRAAARVDNQIAELSKACR